LAAHAVLTRLRSVTERDRARGSQAVDRLAPDRLRQRVGTSSTDPSRSRSREAGYQSRLRHEIGGWRRCMLTSMHCSSLRLLLLLPPRGE
jgi:hypothetical protein